MRENREPRVAVTRNSGAPTLWKIYKFVSAGLFSSDSRRSQRAFL